MQRPGPAFSEPVRGEMRWKVLFDPTWHGGWVTITAQVRIQYDEMYGEKGPVLICSQVSEAEEAVPEVAQF